jgi:two-component system sensor histidine kinase/response regulator
MKILIVDDSETFRQSVVHLLTLRGHEVLEAADGLSGVKMARAHLPDVIVSDIVMSQVDGYAMTAVLRQHSATADIPLVLMTGAADLQGMRKGMTLGADDYIAKPFKMDELIAILNQRVHRRQAMLKEMDRKLSALGKDIHVGLPAGLQTQLDQILQTSRMLASTTPARSAPETAHLAESIHAAARQVERLTVNLFLHAQLALFGTDPEQLKALRQAHFTGAESAVGLQARLQADAAGRSSDLKLKLAPCTVAMAEPHLAKLVAELVANAFQFSPLHTPVNVQCLDDGHNFLLTVADQGPGIPAERTTQILQSETPRMVQSGTGLGLPIVRRLIELHGGKLVINSEPSKGTTIRVSLPASPPPAVPQQSAPEAQLG